MINDNPFLFSNETNETIFDFISRREKELENELMELDGERLLNTSLEDWCNYFENKYKSDIPKILQENIEIDYKEVTLIVDDFGRNTSVKGTEIIYFVPFQGDSYFLCYQPSYYSTLPPYGRVKGNKIVISYQIDDSNKKYAVKLEFERLLNHINSYLEQMSKDLASFEISIKEKVISILESCRQKLLNDQKLVESLGYPVRRNPDVSKTYSVPLIKRKIKVSPPLPNREIVESEPTLNIEEYDYILSIISNMAFVMERSPDTFKNMKEEDIRQHFLVQLNGQYEGQASGETFNYEGKTDILIRVNGKNIFIAECKFWRGEKHFQDDINQLLGYISWRDTKTALLIFNKNKEFTSVVKKIKEITKDHPNYLRELSYDHETGCRFIFHHRDDVDRELILTILAFNIPQ